VTEEIRQRVEYELSIIIKMGFADYFLIVWDYINWSRLHDIPVGPGRGSGVGSIVAYAIGITNVDPLRYDLIFERFLNPDRVSMPDFDVDFCTDRREETIEYVRQRYGRENVAQIITFGTLASRAVIKDVGRVMRVPYSETDRVTKIMDGKSTIRELLGLDIEKCRRKLKEA
ncbi:MAG: DNA polymerase III subunit alpha, partial [Clostridiales bacterium]|nr:DNA polymerase III subunit alpha [Clostridiales bacterium]